MGFVLGSLQLSISLSEKNTSIRFDEYCVRLFPKWLVRWHVELTCPVYVLLCAREKTLIRPRLPSSLITLTLNPGVPNACFAHMRPFCDHASCEAC